MLTEASTQLHQNVSLTSTKLHFSGLSFVVPAFSSNHTLSTSNSDRLRMMNKNRESLSARPKVRNSLLFNEAKVQFEPLNKKTISFIDQDGNKKSIPFISKEFNIKMNSVTYFEPSFDELNKLSPMSLHNWIINCRKYEGMINQLINMPYFRFWSVISYNREVIASLESYLINATRSYRIHPKMKSIEVKVLLSSIHKLVFKVWVRVLLSKESEKNFMLESYHFELVRQILDIPKLFSLVQLYGYGSNSEVLRVLLTPFISLENASFTEEFTQTCSDIADLFKNYLESGFNLEFLSSLYNFVTNVTDIMFTLNKLVLLNANLSAVYLESGLAAELIAFYSNYFSFIESKISDMYKSGQIVENLFKFLHAQLSLTQSSSLLLFHRILQNDLVQRINKENSGKIFDVLGDTLNVVMSNKRFCFDFFTKFSFESEFKPLLENHELNKQLSMDVILEYYQSNLKSIIGEHLAQTTNNKKNDDFSKLISLSYQSAEESPSEQQQKLQQSPAEPALPSVVVSPPVNTIRMDKEITAKEQTIKEMFPDFCDGFIYKCLEHYDFDNEKVLDAILENNLPPHLESLSRELTKNDLLRAQELALQREAEAQISQPAKIAQYDPTSKKDLVPTKIFIGKKDKYSEEMAHKEANKDVTMKLMQKIGEEEEAAKENVKRLMERGKLTKSDLQTNDEYLGLYDDEFDDTYENEDVSFDANDETFEDDEEEDGEEGGGDGNQQQQNGTAPGVGQQRQSSDKFAASQRYNRKQFFNKRNFKRTNEPPPTQQQQPQQHQNQQHQSQQHQNQQRHSQRPQGPPSRQHPSQQQSTNSQQHQHHHNQQQQQSNHHSNHHTGGQQPPRRSHPTRGAHSNQVNSHSTAVPNQQQSQAKPEPKPGPRSHPLPKSEGDNSGSGNTSGGNRGGNSGGNRNRPRMQGHIRSYHGFSGGGGSGGGGR